MIPTVTVLTSCASCSSLDQLLLISIMPFNSDFGFIRAGKLMSALLSTCTSIASHFALHDNTLHGSRTSNSRSCWDIWPGEAAARHESADENQAKNEENDSYNDHREASSHLAARACIFQVAH